MLDAPLPSLELVLVARQDHLRQTARIIFDWKTFLDGFLGVYALSQRKARKLGLDELDVDVMQADLLAKFGQNTLITRVECTNWTTDHGSARSRYIFKSAYLQRVMRLHGTNRVHFRFNLDFRDLCFDVRSWKQFSNYVDDIVATRN